MAEEAAPQPAASTLKSRVFALVQACPAGRVTTYSWLARALGYPRGARMIGWIMNEATEDVPAQRVVNSKGELTGSWAFGPRGTMRQLLEAEGIVFDANDQIDLKRYGWDPVRDLPTEERLALFDAAAHAPRDVSGRLLHLLQHDPASPLREHP